MKKSISILVLVLILFSCSDSNSDNPTSSNNRTFHPPSWIQGRWIYNSAVMNVGYKFATNDVCQVLGSIDNCFKASIDLYNGTQVITAVNEEIISNTEYKLSYTIQSTTFYFHFVKVSATKIKEVVADPDGDLLYTKQ